MATTTLKLDHQDKGWKEICIHKESNSEEFLNPTHALGHHYLHIQYHPVTNAPLLFSFVKGKYWDVTDKD